MELIYKEWGKLAKENVKIGLDPSTHIYLLKVVFVFGYLRIAAFFAFISWEGFHKAVLTMYVYY